MRFRKNSPSVLEVKEVYSMSHGIIARILLVSVCVAYGPVAAEKEAVSIFVFGREHRTQMWLSELRCIGYSPVTVSSVVELIVQVYEDTPLAGSRILLPPKIS